MKKNILFLTTMLLVPMSFMLIACGGGDDEPEFVVSPSSISMHYDGQKQLTADGAVSWATDDDFVATVDQTGLVKGNHVGSTKIVVSNGKRTAYCDVEITPQYNYFDDPILRWGSSKAAIQSSEKHSILGDMVDDNFLAYDYTNGSIPCIMLYVFANGSLSSVMSLLNKAMYAEAGYYLLERYQPAAIGSGTDFYFIDAMSRERAKTVCVLDYYTLNRTSYTGIFFSDIKLLDTPTRGKSSRPEISSDMIEIINQFFKNN